MDLRSSWEFCGSSAGEKSHIVWFKRVTLPFTGLCPTLHASSIHLHILQIPIYSYRPWFCMNFHAVFPSKSFLDIMSYFKNVLHDNQNIWNYAVVCKLWLDSNWSCRFLIMCFTLNSLVPCWLCTTKTRILNGNYIINTTNLIHTSLSLSLY
jgi:hypothetical protein